MVFWEKGGILQDATIVTDSVDQDAFMNLEDLQQQQLEDQAFVESQRLMRMNKNLDTMDSNLPNFGQPILTSNFIKIIFLFLYREI